MNQRTLTFIGTTLLLVLGGAPLLAQDFQPLALGNFWNYLDPQGQPENKVVIGTENILGRDTFVIEYTDSPDNSGLRNFWSSGPNGEVFLHGFTREFGYIYEPPVKYVDPTVDVGQGWLVSFTAYNYADGSFAFESGQIQYLIFESGPIQVGAGVFQALGIGSEDPFLKMDCFEGYGLNGEVKGTPADRAADRWFSGAVGEIQYEVPGGLYQLASFGNETVATTLRSFGGIKALYR